MQPHEKKEEGEHTFAHIRTTVKIQILQRRNSFSSWHGHFHTLPKARVIPKPLDERCQLVQHGQQRHCFTPRPRQPGQELHTAGAACRGGGVKGGGGSPGWMAARPAVARTSVRFNSGQPICVVVHSLQVVQVEVVHQVVDLEALEVHPVAQDASNAAEALDELRAFLRLVRDDL